MNGVLSVESGYIGGSVPHPSYEAVCSGRTGHAEAVRITFDPAVVSYREPTRMHDALKTISNGVVEVDVP